MRVRVPENIKLNLDSPTVDLQIKPVDENGDPVRGAVVNNRATVDIDGGTWALYPISVYKRDKRQIDIDGQYRSARWAAYTFDPVPITITHFGNKVYEATHELADFDRIEEKLYSLEVEVNQTFYPDQFTGAKDARWLGEQFAVVWDPYRVTPKDHYEVSIASSPEYLFDKDSSTYGAAPAAGTDDRGNTVSYSHEVEFQRQFLFDRHSFMDNEFYVAVRSFGTSRGQSNVLTAPGYSPEDYASGTSISGLDVFPDNPNIVQRDVFFLETNVIGPDSPDPRVNFSASGDAQVIASDETTALVRGGGGGTTGTITATSVADNSVTATSQMQTSSYRNIITSPPAPSELAFNPMGQEDGVHISWSRPSIKNATRIAFGDTKNPVIKETSDSSFFVTGLGEQTIDVTVSHVNAIGSAGPEETITISGDPTTRQPAGFVTTPIPEVQVAPGGSMTVPLTNFVRLNGDDPQLDLWSKADVSVDHIKSDSYITVTQPNNAGLKIAAGSGANSASKARDIIVVKIRLGTNDQLPIAFPVARGSTSKFAEAKSVAGIASTKRGLASVDATRLCGENPEVYTEPSWYPDIDSVGSLIGTSLSGNKVELSYNPRQDFRPALSMLKGKDGVSVICMTDSPPPAYTAMQLPLGNIDQIEKPSGWVDYDPDMLQPENNPDSWRRAITENNDLYDLHLFEPAEHVHYAPPIYFGNTWADAHQFPDDAQINFDSGAVTYRNGLTSPTTGPTVVNITKLKAIPINGGIKCEWNAEAQDQNVTGDIALTVTDESGSSFEVSGDGSTTIHGLDPGTKYTIDLLDESTEAYPLHELPSLRIVAWRAPDFSFKYRYEADKSPDEFVDGFGEKHVNPTFPIEKNASDSSTEQEVIFRWDGGEEQSIRAEIDWQLPRAVVEREIDQEVGADFPSAKIDLPRFISPVYEGTKTFALPTNVYRPGTHRLEPSGYLPPEIDGEVEDYVTLYFITPDGENAGREVELDAPTELEARAEITASNQQSPVFYGATVVWWKAEQ